MRPFKAVVIIATSFKPEQQTTISKWLVEQGCLYMMAWGDNCSSWAESVLLANRKAFTTPEIPDQSLVMTTFHDTESLKDVFWYAKHTAMHPCHKLENVLLLHLSLAAREDEFCTELRKKKS